jgi:hypothetical protein
MTHAEYLLLAAADFGTRSFSVEELIITAWKKFPLTFSMKSTTEHPCSNRVLATLCSRHGPKRTGWFDSPEANILRITTLGWTILGALRQGQKAAEARIKEDFTSQEIFNWSFGDKESAILSVMRRCRIFYKESKEWLEKSLPDKKVS